MDKKLLLKPLMLVLLIGIFSVIFSVSYAEKIMCKEGLELVLKTSNKQPICLKPDSAKILVERGWATILEDSIIHETVILTEKERVIKKIDQMRPVYLAQESFAMENDIPNISNKYPTVSLRLSEIAGLDVIIFEGSGFRESHIIDIRIIDDEGNRIKLKTKTTQRGDMLMPWPIPENLEPGIYNVQFWDRVSEHYLTINLE
jgi:hypothetical protein